VPATQRSHAMYDAMMIVLGVFMFVLFLAYSTACDKM
jgi:hypothetical protein